MGSSSRSVPLSCFLFSTPPASFTHSETRSVTTRRPAAGCAGRPTTPRMAGFGGGGGGGSKKKASKKATAAASAASTPATREDGSTKVRADKIYARLVADAGATEHAVLVQAPGGPWRRVGDLAAVEGALPSGVSGGVRAHKREILDAAKRTWTGLAVAAAKGTALVVGTRAGVAEGGEVEEGVTAAAKVALADVEAVPRGTASAFKPRGRKGEEAYFGTALGDGRSRPIDTSTTVGLVKPNDE